MTESDVLTRTSRTVVLVKMDELVDMEDALEDGVVAQLRGLFGGRGFGLRWAGA